MAIVGGNHEVALFARRRSRWSCIGINQRAQNFREHGLCRSLLACDDQHWIGTAPLQGGQQPRDHQHEFIWRWKIEECCEGFDRSASLRNRKRQHASGTTEPDRWGGDDLPSVRPYLDGPPIFVGEVEIGVAVVFSDSGVNRALRGVKLGARLKQIERRPDCLRARSAAGLLIVPTSQPISKLPATNGPGFTMAVDREIGEGGAIGVVKQRFGRTGKGNGKGHRYGALLSIPSEVNGR